MWSVSSLPPSEPRCRQRKRSQLQRKRISCHIITQHTYTHHQTNTSTRPLSVDEIELHNMITRWLVESDEAATSQQTNSSPLPSDILLCLKSLDSKISVVSSDPHPLNQTSTIHAAQFACSSHFGTYSQPQSYSRSRQLKNLALISDHNVTAFAFYGLPPCIGHHLRDFRCPCLVAE